MNKFKFFVALLLATVTALAFYGCGDNQTDNTAKKDEKTAAEVKAQDEAAAKKAKEEAEKKAKEEALRRAQQETYERDAAILGQANQALEKFFDDVRNNRIRMGSGARNRILNFQTQDCGVITESYVIFRGFSSGNKTSLHVVKENGVWKCVDMNPDWDIDPHYQK